jgi:hypothetical protein
MSFSVVRCCVKHSRLVLALAVTLAYAFMPSSSHADAQPGRCKPSGSITRAATKYVRVYTLPSRDYAEFACHRRTGWTRKLGDFDRVSQVAAAGRFVVWDRSVCDSHNHCVSHGVRVLDMRTRKLRREKLPREDDSYAMRVVVTPKGSAAWLRLEGSDRTGVEVRRLVGRRQTTLDSGSAITRDYLELARDEARRLVVRWRNAGELESALIR